MAKTTKMSSSMEHTLSYLRYKVEKARTLSFEEYLKDYKYALDAGMIAYLKTFYDEEKNGIVRGMYDGRTLNGLRKRGYIEYYDDLNLEVGNWIIILNEDEETEEQAETTESVETVEDEQTTTEAEATTTEAAETETTAEASANEQTEQETEGSAPAAETTDGRQEEAKATYQITSKYHGDADEFKGMVFGTKESAAAMLEMRGWKYNGYDWEREGSPYAVGALFCSTMQYVEITKV